MNPAQMTEVRQTAAPQVASRPRVAVRADLPSGWRVLGAVPLLGVPLGVLWAWLAPPEIVVALADPAVGRVELVPLMGQSQHRFAALAAFVLFGMAAGVLTGVALWLWRSRRGPVVLVAAVLGSLVAGWIAKQAGLAVAGWRYPDPAEVAPGAVLARAPVLESAWVLVAQPFGAALAYSFAVAWNGADDLGREPEAG